jgi:hypothetical protein
MKMCGPVKNVPRATVKIVNPEVRNFDERGEYPIPRDYWELRHEYGRTFLLHLSGRYQYELSPDDIVVFEESRLDCVRPSTKQGLLRLGKRVTVYDDGLVIAKPLSFSSLLVFFAGTPLLACRVRF